jgi:branched-chain amino acid transport system permease protein
MDLYVQLLANTLQVGAVYVLFSLGLTLIFGVMKIVNFAHGEFFTAAALAMSVAVPWFTKVLGWPVLPTFVLSFGIAILVVLCLGFIVFKLGFVRYLRDLIGSFIVSIGFVLLLEGIYLEIFGGSPRTIPPLIEGTAHILGAAITWQRLLICALALAITVALHQFVSRTRLGLALRAVAEDQEAAMLQGIDYRSVALQGFLIGCALAAAAGAFMAPLAAITTYMGADFLIKAFIIIIVGGLGSIPGAIIGGFIVAAIESFGGYYFDPSTATISLFVLVIVGLLVRPQGIMGNAER